MYHHQLATTTTTAPGGAVPVSPISRVLGYFLPHGKAHNLLPLALFGPSPGSLK